MSTRVIPASATKAFVTESQMSRKCNFVQFVDEVLANKKLVELTAQDLILQTRFEFSRTSRREFNHFGSFEIEHLARLIRESKTLQRLVLQYPLFEEHDFTPVMDALSSTSISVIEFHAGSFTDSQEAQLRTCSDPELSHELTEQFGYRIIVTKPWWHNTTREMVALEHHGGAAAVVAQWMMTG
jgi:hypothetical protein